MQIVEQVFTDGRIPFISPVVANVCVIEKLYRQFDHLINCPVCSV